MELCPYITQLVSDDCYYLKLDSYEARLTVENCVDKYWPFEFYIKLEKEKL